MRLIGFPKRWSKNARKNGYLRGLDADGLYYSIFAVSEITGITANNLRQLKFQGLIPPGIKIGPRLCAWTESDINEILLIRAGLL